MTDRPSLSTYASDSTGDRIPQIRLSVGIERILAGRDIFPTSRSGETVLYRCPMPGHEDRNPSFTVKGPSWRCWSACDQHGDVVDLVVALDRCSKSEAIDGLASLIGLDRPQRASRPHKLPEPKAQELLDRFVAKRGWNPKAVEEAGLHVVLDCFGRPRMRFPYYYGDEVVWYQDRAIGDVSPKWLSPKKMTPAIFNANALRLAHKTMGAICILEGPTDVMALWSTYEVPLSVGIPGAGNFRAEWVEVFTGLEKVFVIGDNDDAGAKFRQRCAGFLTSAVNRVVQVYVPPCYGDLDDWYRSFDPCEPEVFGESFERAVHDGECRELDLT